MFAGNALEILVNQAPEDCIEALSEWDALVYVYMHGVSLSSADHLSRLLGYFGSQIAAVVEEVAKGRLIDHSARSHAVRMYWFAARDTVSNRRLAALLTSVNDKRVTRIIVARVSFKNARCIGQGAVDERVAFRLSF